MSLTGDSAQQSDRRSVVFQLASVWYRFQPGTNSRSGRTVRPFHAVIGCDSALTDWKAPTLWRHRRSNEPISWRCSIDEWLNYGTRWITERSGRSADSSPALVEDGSSWLMEPIFELLFRQVHTGNADGKSGQHRVHHRRNQHETILRPGGNFKFGSIRLDSATWFEFESNRKRIQSVGGLHSVPSPIQLWLHFTFFDSVRFNSIGFNSIGFNSIGFNESLATRCLTFLFVC